MVVSTGAKLLSHDQVFLPLTLSIRTTVKQPYKSSLIEAALIGWKHAGSWNDVALLYLLVHHTSVVFKSFSMVEARR